MKAEEHARWSEAKIRSHDRGTIWSAIALVWCVGAIVTILSISRQDATGIVLPFAAPMYGIAICLLIVLCLRCQTSWLARSVTRRFHHLPVDDDSELL